MAPGATRFRAVDDAPLAASPSPTPKVAFKGIIRGGDSRQKRQEKKVSFGDVQTKEGTESRNQVFSDDGTRCHGKWIHIHPDPCRIVSGKLVGWDRLSDDDDWNYRYLYGQNPVSHFDSASSIAATEVNKLKRGRESSSLDDEEVLVLPPSKKSRNGLDVIVQSKSLQSVHQAVRNTAATRLLKPLPRFSQSANPAFNSVLARDKAGRASAGRRQETFAGVMSSHGRTTRPSAAIAPNRSSAGEFSIHQDTADEELENLLSHSTHSLAIAEDADRNDPGKENVPPPGHVPGPRSKMPTKRRIPLGELDVESVMGLRSE
ncbi:hypothetical protein MMC07_003100 [Pseudocyphellaria aurata]|nr:hypothetical protein [Pseudocyphellaria aurata]